MNECLECGTTTANQKYCSRSCSTTSRNRISKVKTGEYKANRTCGVCPNQVRSGRKYCSPECRVFGMSMQRLRGWLDGSLVFESEYEVPPFARKYLLHQAGNRCASPACAVPGGWSEVNPSTGKVPLNIDHIDGNAKNNRKENLIVLCPNCHSLTPTYGALNKGNGRSYRYKQAPSV